MDEIIKNYWHVLGFVFVLGGFATVIATLRRDITVLFTKSREAERKLDSHSVQVAVTAEKLTNIERQLTEIKTLFQGFLQRLETNHG
jgi:hypothetical protein